MLTFIIPSIGRKTLINTIESLKNQTNKNFKCIIIFDGIKPNIKLEDKRFLITSCEKKGENKNNSGLVRNIGIELSNTNWIAFVDDDDILTTDYVEKFYIEINLKPNLKTIIFRMVGIYNNVYKIFPKVADNNFIRNNVGISFAIHKDIYFNQKIKFKNSSTEDFYLLDDIRKNKDNLMVISPYITYIIRNIKQKYIYKNLKRIYINN